MPLNSAVIDSARVISKFRKLNAILLEQTAFAPDVHGLSPMENIYSILNNPRSNFTATMEHKMSEDDVVGVGEYEGAAGGARSLRRQIRNAFLQIDTGSASCIEKPGTAAPAG